MAKLDTKLTVPRVSDAATNQVISQIVSVINELLVNQEELEKAVEDDARRKHSIDSRLDKVGTLRIKKIGNNNWQLEGRTESGWKKLHLVDNAGDSQEDDVSPLFIRFK